MANQKTEDIFFKSDGHKERFFAIMQKIGKIDAGKLDNEYAAAVFILTADLSTWHDAAEYVKPTGIDFETLLEEVDFSGGYTVLLKWACNLFNSNMHIDPVELMRLDESNYLVALSALKLRRYSMRVEKEQ
jgi:hypothetical protein